MCLNLVKMNEAFKKMYFLYGVQLSCPFTITCCTSSLGVAAYYNMIGEMICTKSMKIDPQDVPPYAQTVSSVPTADTYNSTL